MTELAEIRYAHANGRLALDTLSPSQRTAAAILTPRAGTEPPDADEPWFRAETPEHFRVPVNDRYAGMRYTRSLDLEQQRETLAASQPLRQEAAAWPCDKDPAQLEPRPLMGSLKIFEAKKQCTEVRKLVQDEHMEVALARKHQAETGTQAVVDTVESLMQLGLTGFEASMENFERADRELARMRMNTTARPPMLDYDPELTKRKIKRLRHNYYSNRSKEFLMKLKMLDIDRTEESCANGGPAANRQPKDPLEGLDYDFHVVEEPSSPMRFTCLQHRRPNSKRTTHGGPGHLHSQLQQTSAAAAQSTESCHEMTQRVETGPGNVEQSLEGSPPLPQGKALKGAKTTVKKERVSATDITALTRKPDAISPQMATNVSQHLSPPPRSTRDNDHGESPTLAGEHSATHFSLRDTTLSNRPRVQKNPVWVETGNGLLETPPASMPPSRGSQHWKGTKPPQDAFVPPALLASLRRQHVAEEHRARVASREAKRRVFDRSSPVVDQWIESQSMRNEAERSVERAGLFMTANAKFVPGRSWKLGSSFRAAPRRSLNNTV